MTDLLTPQQVCQQLQIARATLYRWVGDNRVPYIKLPNGKLRFNPERLQAWLEKQTYKPIPCETKS